MFPTNNPPLIPPAGPAQPGNGLAQLAAYQQQQAAKRAVYGYTVPPDIVEEAQAESNLLDIRRVNVRVLTPNEEANAIKRANGDPVQIAFELALACLASVDIGGELIVDIDAGESQLVGSEEIVTAGKAHDALATFNRMHMKIRDLLLAAYQDLHKPKEDQTKGFLASRKVRL